MVMWLQEATCMLQDKPRLCAMLQKAPRGSIISEIPLRYSLQRNTQQQTTLSVAEVGSSARYKHLCFLCGSSFLATGRCCGLVYPVPSWSGRLHGVALLEFKLWPASRGSCCLLPKQCSAMRTEIKSLQYCNDP